MQIAEVVFVVCSSCGEWAWNGTYFYNQMIVLDPSFSKPSAICFCCIREKMNQEGTWYDASWWEDSSKFKIDMKLICRN